MSLCGKLDYWSADEVRIGVRGQQEFPNPILLPNLVVSLAIHFIILSSDTFRYIPIHLQNQLTTRPLYREQIDCQKSIFQNPVNLSCQRSFYWFPPLYLCLLGMSSRLCSYISFDFLGTFCSSTFVSHPFGLKPCMLLISLAHNESSSRESLHIHLPRRGKFFSLRPTASPPLENLLVTLSFW